MPARLLVRHADGKVEERDPEDLSELRDRPCWLDVSDPNDTDLDLVAKELSLHPLALEDARHRHQRPKIDQYEGHYFLIEILKVLTSVATILLVVTLITSFFGQNFTAIPFGSEGLFWASLAAIAASVAGLALYFRRRDRL